MQRSNSHPTLPRGPSTEHDSAKDNERSMSVQMLRGSPEEPATPPSSPVCSGPQHATANTHVREVDIHVLKNIIHPSRDAMAQRHMLCIVNPYAGGAGAQAVFDQFVRPIFKAVGLRFTIVSTEYAGHATKIAAECDLSTSDAIAIVGGDGMVQEVVTGLCSRGDDTCTPLCLVPGGSANAFAHMLYPGCLSRECLAKRSAVAAILGYERRVDIMQLLRPDKPPRYALSLFGWGACSVVAARAERMRWLPFHRMYRYSLAGALSLFGSTPSRSHGRLFIPMDERAPTSSREFDLDLAVREGWREEALDAANLMACNVPKLGVNRPVARNITVDDGFLSLTVVPGYLSRIRIFKILYDMKNGQILQDQPGVVHRRLREFILIPEEPIGHHHPPDFLIDGDIFPASPVHVKVLHQRISVMTEDAADHGHPTRESVRMFAQLLSSSLSGELDLHQELHGVQPVNKVDGGPLAAHDKKDLCGTTEASASTTTGKSANDVEQQTPAPPITSAGKQNISLHTGPTSMGHRSTFV